MFLSGPRRLSMFIASIGEKKKKSNLEFFMSSLVTEQKFISGFRDLGRILKVKATDDTLGHLGVISPVDTIQFNGIWLLKMSFLKSGLKTKTKPSYDCDTSVGVSDCDSRKPRGNRQSQCSTVTRCDLKQDGEERFSQNAMSCHNSSQHGEAAWKINIEILQKCAILIHFPLLLLKCFGRLSLKANKV